MPRYNLDEREQTSLIRSCLRNKDLYSTSRHNFWIRVTDDLHDLCNTLTYTARTCAKYVNKMMNERDDALADALANNTDDANSDRGEDWILAVDQWIEFVVSPEAALKPKRTVRNTAAVCPYTPDVYVQNKKNLSEFSPSIGWLSLFYIRPLSFNPPTPLRGFHPHQRLSSLHYSSLDLAGIPRTRAHKVQNENSLVGGDERRVHFFYF